MAADREPDTAAPFKPGDRLSYYSVTQPGHLVEWTRDESGEWHANDENWTARGPASDTDAYHAVQSNDVTYTPAGSDGT